MKVIKPGRSNQWSIVRICTGEGNNGGGCGAELLVELSDLYLTHQSHYDGSRDDFVTFSCAQCGVQTDLEEKDWPQELTYKKRKGQ